MLTRSQKTTIVSLQSYLTRIAHNLHRTHWSQVDPQDILAEMNLHIAEQAEADPAFLEQTRGYITKAATWHARHWCRATFTRHYNGQRVSANVALEMDGDDNDRPTDEVYTAPQPDNDIAIDIRTALAGLDGVSFRIAQLKMAGMKRKDIAAELGMSSQGLSWYLRRIEAALKPVWQAVTGQPEGPRQLSFSLRP